MTINADPDLVGLAAFGIYGGPAPYLAGVDKTGRIPEKYGVRRFPTIMILDRRKRVRYIGHEEDPNSPLAHTGKAIDQILKSLLGR
ncbi:MAG: peroxiredoxin family protein [Nitrospinota bacterium]